MQPSLYGLLLLAGMHLSLAYQEGQTVFLQGTYLEVGVHPASSLGSTTTAPAGYHVNSGSGKLGISADYGMDGWSTGSPPYSGDYFLPGTPEEGWTLEFTDTNGVVQRFNNYGLMNQIDIAPAAIVETSSGTRKSVEWLGTAGATSTTATGSNLVTSAVQVQKTIYFNEDDLFFTVQVVLTNVGASAITKVQYLHNIDPDQEQPWSTRADNYDTCNTVVSQPTDPDANCTALVRAQGKTLPQLYLALATINCNARVTYGGFVNRNPTPIYNSPMATGQTRCADEAVSLAYRFDSLAPTESVSFFYTFILEASAGLDAALAFMRSYTFLVSSFPLCAHSLGQDTMYVGGLLPAGRNYSITFTGFNELSTHLTLSLGGDVLPGMVMDPPAGTRRLSPFRAKLTYTPAAASVTPPGVYILNVIFTDDSSIRTVCSVPINYADKVTGPGDTAAWSAGLTPVECPNNCNFHGSCDIKKGACYCDPGFTGDDCSRKECPNGCYGQGFCDNNGNCQCLRAFWGYDCRYSKCPGGCGFNGRCDFLNDNCICNAGWFGNQCQYKLCPMNCTYYYPLAANATGPQVNETRGTCNYDTGICRCKPGYFDDDCSKTECPLDCAGNGACNYHTGKCRCYPGFSGQDCLTVACPRNCSGHGRCDMEVGQCFCDEGYSNWDCSTLGTLECSGNGHADHITGHCMCKAGYFGHQCEMRVPEGGNPWNAAEFNRGGLFQAPPIRTGPGEPLR
eukprot:tig00020780_g13783.t1